MCLSHALGRLLLVCLLVSLSGGLVLRRSRRQVAEVPAPQQDPLRSWFTDGADFEGLDVSAETPGRRGMRGPLAHGFGNPLDRISAERRPIQLPRNLPRRRITVPLDRIGGFYMTQRRSWSDYPQAERDIYEDDLNYLQMEATQQLMGDP